ncbi:hypothetical protein [Abyssicoccus albus]|uniref:hypothetical protein n=1 Tax=Abyssicoccus albus TaxID=1817405 RepID=UPI000F4F0518|nr:hypothetical protein [Abyssicoccus albus]
MFRKKIITILGIFFVGNIIFNNLGWLLAFYLKDKVYVLQGNEDLLINIIDDIYILNFILIFLLVIHPKTKLSMDKLQDYLLKVVSKDNFFISLITYSTVVVCLIFMIIIDLQSAPLFNIGQYTFSEMQHYRKEIFNTPLLQSLSVVRSLILYMITPLLFLKKGLGVKHNFFIDIVLITFSLLTLSKTAFILILFFYWMGKMLSNFSFKYVLYLIVSVSTAFYLIVYLTYYVDVQRDFYSVIEVLVIRLLASPIALCALYAELFSFNDGFRSSQYYTILFGGQAAQIPIIAMQHIDVNSRGNAPAGIIGSAYPNIPLLLHWGYYLSFSTLIYIISIIGNNIKSIILGYLIIPLYGILTWFLYLTEPLVALNSYGILYLSILIIIIFLFQPKRRTIDGFKRKSEI